MLYRKNHSGCQSQRLDYKNVFVFIIYLFSAYKLKREAYMNIAYAKREEGQIMQLINILWQKSTKKRQEERDGCPLTLPRVPRAVDFL